MGNFNRDRSGRGGFGGRRRHGFGGGRGGNREMFSATCSNCGKECHVPFRPTNGKPVYCSDCFEKMGGGRDSKRPERNNFRAMPQANDQSKAQLDAMNAKLDKILSILSPAPVEVASEVEKEPEEKKVKKVSSKKKE